MTWDGNQRAITYEMIPIRISKVEPRGNSSLQSRGFFCTIGKDTMKLFIGCSSSDKISDEYIEETRSIASELSNQDFEVILTGEWSSMNGACYEEFVSNRKKVTVVISEKQKQTVDKMENANLAILQNVFRCSESIYNKTDIVLFLPGGIDIMAILWSSLKANMMQQIPKPIIIYNMNGYYNTVITCIEQMLMEQFEVDIIREWYQIFTDKKEMFEYINSLQQKPGKVLKK